MRPRARRTTAILTALVFVSATPLTAAAKGKPAPPEPTTITFSGYEWSVKDHKRKLGPGPNFFSASNVHVDSAGRLHLEITPQGKKWTVAEVINTRSDLGYGTYSWTLGSAPVLDPNVVLGLFTWNDDPAYNHREIDIEYAKWGNAGDPNNAQYVVQPYSTLGNEHRWQDTSLLPGSTHSFTWLPGRVDFESRAADGSLLHSWSYTGPDVPLPGGENVRMNLWLFRGSAPIDGQPVEVIIESFTHQDL
jgi:hypothetical protein